MSVTIKHVEWWRLTADDDTKSIIYPLTTLQDVIVPNTNIPIVGKTNSKGTCTTAKAEARKDVYSPEFQLVKGAQITVTFVNGNSAANPTLSVATDNATYPYISICMGKQLSNGNMVPLPIDSNAIRVGDTVTLMYTWDNSTTDNPRFEVIAGASLGTVKYNNNTKKFNLLGINVDNTNDPEGYDGAGSPKKSYYDTGIYATSKPGQLHMTSGEVVDDLTVIKNDKSIKITASEIAGQIGSSVISGFNSITSMNYIATNNQSGNNLRKITITGSEITGASGKENLSNFNNLNVKSVTVKDDTTTGYAGNVSITESGIVVTNGASGSNEKKITIDMNNGVVDFKNADMTGLEDTSSETLQVTDTATIEKAVITTLENATNGSSKLNNVTTTGTMTLNNTSTSIKGLLAVEGTSTFTTAPTFNTPLAVSSGGTGTNSLTNNGFLLGHGTNAVTALTPAKGVVYYDASKNPGIVTNLPVSHGGTGLNTIANHAIIVGRGTDAITTKIGTGAIYYASDNQDPSIGVLPVAQGGTGQTSIANIQAGKDESGNNIKSTYAVKLTIDDNKLKLWNKNDVQLGADVTLPITNNLTSASTVSALSAAQGKALAEGSARDDTKVLKAGDTMTGTLTISGNNAKFIHGTSNTASGNYASASGDQTVASGNYSHTEGTKTTASGLNTHAEGDTTLAVKAGSHAEGVSTTANGSYSHAEGSYTRANDTASHSEGSNTRANGMYSHAEGNVTTAGGQNAHAEGTTTLASGIASHAEGSLSKATNRQSHAEGSDTTASGESSHAEGVSTSAQGNASHAEGTSTSAVAVSSHAEGNTTRAANESAHAEGNATVASGTYSHAEGNATQASESSAHAEGSNTTASGSASHAEGTSTKATYENAHAEGNTTTAGNKHAHAEGQNTLASGIASHAEGYSTKAVGNYSHAEGNLTTANAAYSHASGSGTCAYSEDMFVCGSYNDTSVANALFVVGNGASNTNRSNAMSIDENGAMTVAGTVTAPTFAGNLTGTATKATGDESGNNIKASYGSSLGYDPDTGKVSLYNKNNVSISDDAQIHSVITAGTAKGEEDDKTLAFSGTFKIPTITYDKNGHISSWSYVTMTMPAKPAAVNNLTSTDTDNYLAANQGRVLKEKVNEIIDLLKKLSISYDSTNSTTSISLNNNSDSSWNAAGLTKL